MSNVAGGQSAPVAAADSPIAASAASTTPTSSSLSQFSSGLDGVNTRSSLTATLYPKRFTEDDNDMNNLTPNRFPDRSASFSSMNHLDVPAPNSSPSQSPNSPLTPPIGAPHLCGHKARFHHISDDGQDIEEKDAQEIPEGGLGYSKDEHGMYQFQQALPSNRSKVNLASLNAPASVGAGPRGPPVALVSSAITRASSSGFDPLSRVPYNRVVIDYAPSTPSIEFKETATQVRKCLELRTKFVWTPHRDEAMYDIFQTPVYTHPKLEDQMPPKEENMKFKFEKGVFTGWMETPNGEKKAESTTDASAAVSASSPSASSSSSSSSSTPSIVFAAPDRSEFGKAMGAVMDFVLSGPAKSFCHSRLHILEARFNLHELLNHDLEQLVQKSVPHRDFYNVRKIDNHVHHSAAMNQKHLLRFIKSKLKKGSDEHVIIRDGKKLTLNEVFETLGMTSYDLNVDTLDMHADKTFHRFDKFNLKYNPLGESRLREVFLKYNNYIKGKYLAEITQQVFEDLESNKYQFAEYRLSIYGAKKQEWDILAEWVVDNKLFSSNVRWMIQVTVDPSSHPKLHVFLRSCIGFDMVDDESLRERPFNDSMPEPTEWNLEYDPPYALFAYYLYANIYALNQMRAHRGMNTFSFRPHSGEAGDIEHLASTFLLAKGINHGIMLQKSPSLQYLYYLSQIGISVSPLSNNLLFLEYDKNPFPKFFKKGLNVTLSTDDPLMIHVTREPLVEEYSVAAQVWKLSAIDMSEIARNSVLQSGFEQPFKTHFLGNSYWVRGVEGNDIRQTNVPDIRVQFRAELLNDEFRTLKHYSGLEFDDTLVDRIV